MTMKRIISMLLALALLLCGLTAFAEDWICGSCGQENNGNFCINCGAPKSEQAEEAAAVTYAAGDHLTFGTYEQDNNKKNGAEPIEWRVLNVNSDGTYLLMSEYALDYRDMYASSKDSTWEVSQTREWLNGTFLNSAFSAAERACLIEIQNDNSGGLSNPHQPDTADTVSLLSGDELSQYIEWDEKGSSWWCTPTAYAASREGAWVVDSKSAAEYDIAEGICWFWALRPVGNDGGHEVNVFGSTAGCEYDQLDSYGSDSFVRPVIVVDFSNYDPDAVFLENGSRGDEVKELQQLLIERGFLSGSADGVFGNGTEKAVKAAQTAYALPVTGAADKALLSALRGN